MTALGSSDLPYLKERTWDGTYRDYFAIDLQNGKRRKVAERLGERPDLSPNGNYVMYYQGKNWHLLDISQGVTRNVTADLGVPFEDEDHDYPSDPPGYGLGGWLDGDAGAILYDKYDLWLIDTGTGRAVNLTKGKGRENRLVFRIVRTDPEEASIDPSGTLLLSAYHDLEKYSTFYQIDLPTLALKRLGDEEHKYTFIAKARDSEHFLYSRQHFREYPDLWVSTSNWSKSQKVSDLNSQFAGFKWGTPELVEWRSMDGIPLQGILIKPDGYDPGKR